MVLTQARRQHLVLSWIAIAVTWITSLALEMELLGSRAPLAMAITTTIALIVGIVITRRATATHGRAKIKVGDLRQRRAGRRGRELTR